jgi:uncharacterized protein involved in exopolysaccharide biosynthesis
MELKQLIAVFKKDRVFFIGTVLVIVFVAFLWQKNQKPLSEATLLLNIGRSGIDQTSAYTYDSFYRLQADERFADTVVRWLASPRVVEDIYNEAHLNPEALGIRDLKKVFKAARLSSQMIEVTYGGPNEKLLGQLSQSVTTVLARYTADLNREDKEKNWFVVIGSEPVVRDGRVPSTTVLLLGLALGVFVAFWGVLIRYYFSEN